MRQKTRYIVTIYVNEVRFVSDLVDEVWIKVLRLTLGSMGLTWSELAVTGDE